MNDIWYSLREARPFSINELTGRVFSFAKITSPINAYLWVQNEVAGTYKNKVLILFATNNYYWWWQYDSAHFDYYRIKSSGVQGSTWTVVIEAYRISNKVLETIQATFNVSSQQPLEVKRLSSTTTTDTERFLEKTVTQTSGEYTCSCTLSVEDNIVYCTFATTKTDTGELVYTDKQKYMEPRFGGTMRIHDYHYIVEEKLISASAGYQSLLLNLEYSLGTKTKKSLGAGIPTRYMGWLKGSASVLDVPLLGTPKDSHNEDVFHFVVVCFDFVSMTVNYAVYDKTGQSVQQNGIVLDLGAMTGTQLTFTGSMQEFFVDYGNTVNDDFIRRVIVEKNQIGRAGEGYDSSKQWFVLNVADPNAVESNAFIPRAEGAPPPVGAVYYQLPPFTIGEVTYTPKTPKELWNNTEWVNASEAFAGDFFRVEGGNALAFGSGRQESMFGQHSHSYTYSYGTGSNKQHGGVSNSYFVTGTGSSNVATSATGGAETRPQNQSIRVWYRIK